MPLDASINLDERHFFVSSLASERLRLIDAGDGSYNLSVACEPPGNTISFETGLAVSTVTPGRNLA